MKQKFKTKIHIDVPDGIVLEKDLLVDAIPFLLKLSLMKSREFSMGRFILHFEAHSKYYTFRNRFLITASHYEKTILIVVQKEERIIAPFATVKALFEGVVNAIQEHINNLIVAEDSINFVNAFIDNQNKTH